MFVWMWTTCLLKAMKGREGCESLQSCPQSLLLCTSIQHVGCDTSTDPPCAKKGVL